MRVLHQLATNAAHPSKKPEALSLREEGFAFLTCGRGEGRVASLPLANRIEAAVVAAS
jgi:hypothetical protein